MRVVSLRVTAVMVICFVKVLCLGSIFAQGTINFANLVVVDGVRLVDAPVSYSNGALVSGPEFAAQLYAGRGFSSLSPVALSSPFLSGAEAGYFSGGTRTIDWVLPGQAVLVQVRVWQLSTGPTWETAIQRAESVTMTIQTGGLNGAPPANLIGLPPFGFIAIPEPSTLALLLLGATVLGARVRRR